MYLFNHQYDRIFIIIYSFYHFFIILNKNQINLIYKTSNENCFKLDAKLENKI